MKALCKFSASHNPSAIVRLKGGAGSGNFAHEGRPGLVGGSGEGGMGHGLQAIDTFKGGKAILTPDGQLIKNIEGVRSHTQVYARLIMENPGDYKSRTIEDAEKVISRDMEEYGFVEQPVMEKGYVSIEVDFMGGVTVVANNGHRDVSSEEFNSLFRRIQRMVDRGTIDVPSADRITIHYNNANFGIPYNELYTVSGFTMSEFGKPLAHYKSYDNPTAVIHIKGGAGSGNFAHEGRPGLVGGSGEGGFNGWFKNSKVVNMDGSPKVVYHGTNASFEVFAKSNDIGYHFGDRKAAMKARTSMRHGDKADWKIGSYYLSIQNPLEMPDLQNWRLFDIVPILRHKGVLPEDFNWMQLPDEARDLAAKEQPGLLEKLNAGKTSGMTQGDWDNVMSEWSTTVDMYKRKVLQNYIKKAGYDGIVYYNAYEGGESFIAFDPTQIKSTNNSGAYDPNNPNVNKQAIIHIMQV